MDDDNVNSPGWVRWCGPTSTERFAAVRMAFEEGGLHLVHGAEEDRRVGLAVVPVDADWDVVSAVRRATDPSIPILVLGADAPDGHAHARSKGADAFEPWPAATNRLLIRVGSLLHEGRSRSGPDQVSRAVLLDDGVLGMISHDLKSPVSAIRMCMEGLRTSGLSELQQEMVEDAREASDALLRMLDDVASLTSASEVRVRARSLDATALIEETVHRYQRTAQLARRRIDVRSGRGITVDTDPSLLRRILSNLLDHSLAWAPEGSGIDVRAEVVDRQLQLQVMDRGPRIPDEHKGAFFEAAGAARARTGERRGRGLGLAFVQFATRALGGEVTAEDRRGEGTRFRVRLPLRSATPLAELPGARAPRRASVPDRPQLGEGVVPLGTKGGVRASVLLVDDDPNFRPMTRRVLASAGHNVLTAETAREARRILETHPEIEVLLSDVHLPGEGGVELLRHVRSAYPRLPVILMSARPTLPSALDAVALGAVRYFVKPIAQQELLGAVQESARLGRLAEVQAALAQHAALPASIAGDPAHLSVALDKALDAMWMAWQPIVRYSTGEIFAWEALLRSDDPNLCRPDLIVGAAERLDRLPELGAAVRAAVARDAMIAPEGQLLFMNLHPRDLFDDRMGGAGEPLLPFAGRVVLEITERASLDGADFELQSRIDRLREQGFRTAVDDLGSGYAGLSSFATLRPDVVKLDMTLVRDIDSDRVRQRLVQSLADACEDLDIALVVEGVETEAERDTLVALGADLMQGFLFARPLRGFVVPEGLSWYHMVAQ